MGVLEQMTGDPTTGCSGRSAARPAAEPNRSTKRSTLGQFAEKPWYKERVAALLEEFGAVPPPWVYEPDSHPYSMRWRMGDGETLIMVFTEWWDAEQKDFDKRVAYFRKWPPPPRWLPWMANILWDLEPWEIRRRVLITGRTLLSLKRLDSTAAMPTSGTWKTRSG